MIHTEAAATFGWAWLSATLALGVHVTDEATHDFLAWYNPLALRIRRALGGLPFPPTFEFRYWLLGLLVGILSLAALIPFAFDGQGWLRPIAYLLAVIHIGNGLLHIIGSGIAKRPLPGVLSAPLLVVTGIWLAYAAATLT